MSEKMQEFKLLIKQFNMVERLDKIIDWKNNFGTPNITVNLSSIQEMADNLRINVIPAIQENISKLNEIKNDVNETIIPQIRNIHEKATEVQLMIENSLPEIEAAAAIMDEAIEEAESVLIVVRKFKGRLDEAVIKLKNNNDIFIDNANNLINVVRNEIDNIGDAFINLGNKMKAGADVIVDEAGDIGNALIGGHNEIKIPLNRCIHYINLIRNPNLFDLAFVFYNIFKIFSHMSFENYGGQGGVFEEVMEMFSEIGNEFKDVGVALLDFGSTTKDESEKIILASNNAVINIRDAINVFVGSLSFNLHGWSLELLEPEDKDLLFEREENARIEANNYAHVQADNAAKYAGAWAAAFCYAFIGAFAQAFCAAFAVAFCKAFCKALGGSPERCEEVCNAKRDEYYNSDGCKRARENAIAKARAEGKCDEIYWTAYNEKFSEVYPIAYRQKYTELILGVSY